MSAEITKPKNSSFNGIILVVLFATIAFATASFLIKINTIQYSTLPKAVSLKVTDPGNGNSTRIIKLPIQSKLPIDTVQKSKFGGKYIGDDVLFHQNPALLMWTMLICIMISIAAGSVPAFIGQISELKENFSLDSKQIRLGVFAALILALFLGLTNMKLPGYYTPPAIMKDLLILFNNPHTPLWIVGITICLMLPALTIIFLVGLCSDKILSDTKEVDENPDKVLDIKDIEVATKRLKILHKTLQGVVQILAVIVVFSVLTSSALGQAIKATVEIKGFDLYPKEASLVYGMYFSLFLCIIYIPVYYYIKQNYNSLKTMAIDLNPPDEVKEKSWYKDLFGDSKFEGSALDNLKLAFTLLAPLLTSFLPESLHFFK